MSAPPTRRVIFEHAILRAVGSPVQTSEGAREYIRLEISDWVNIVGITADARVILVRQHRHGIDAETLEIPGGCVDPGEAPADAAARELLEETGYGDGAWRSLGWVWSNPAIQNNRTHLFLASGLRLLGPPQLGPGEADLRVELRPVGEVPELLRSGEVNHSLAVVALQRWLLGG
ncbi:MAG: NUDIX hydrolase [Deltaproteobacteria bacterium]|nr:NUDIX hydrolase [Deltaproteobacteria bacterium]